MAKIVKIDDKTRERLRNLEDIPRIVEKMFDPIRKEIDKNLPEIPRDLTKLSDEDLINYRLSFVRWIEFLDNNLRQVDEIVTIAKEKRNVLQHALINSLVSNGMSKAQAKEALQDYDEYNQYNVEILLYNLLKSRYELEIKHLSSIANLLSREQTRRGDEARRFTA